jgi:hypothetical protein
MMTLPTPKKFTWFGESPAGPRDDDPTDKDGHKCYATIAFVVAGRKQREQFKIPMMTTQEWIEINLKAFPLPFYATFGLLAAPPLGPNCEACGKEHVNGEECEFVKINNVKPQRFVGSSYQPCNYPFCEARGQHVIKVCPELNHRCERCLFRGHSKAADRCNQVQANLATFEAAAMHGYVTKNRMRNWGAANGFFPVIRLSQLHHIAAHGGYARLVSLTLSDAEQFINEADEAHDRWVGAEPLSTQYAVEETFTRTKFNKELSGAYKHHYAMGNQYSARKRVPPQQVGQAQTEEIAATGRILRDYVYNQPPIELDLLTLEDGCTRCGGEHDILSGC